MEARQMQNEEYSFSIEVEPVAWHSVSDLLSQLGAKATINLKKAGDFPVIIDVMVNNLSLPGIVYGLSELQKNICKQHQQDKDYIKIIINKTPACFREYSVEEITAAIQTGKGLLALKKDDKLDKINAELEIKAKAVKKASKRLAYVGTPVKNQALKNIAADLMAKCDEILAANKIDYTEAEASGMNVAMLDRLLLTKDRLQVMAKDILTVAALPDPVGEVMEMRTLENGLMVGKKRVPLGVIGAIYESRPNVTVDIASLCIKSGNGCILRGGKETIHSNMVLAKVIQDAITRAGLPDGIVQVIENTDRALVNQLLKMSNYIDMVVPRGGAGLIKFVRDNAAMPVVSGGIGVCHTYVDAAADIEKAVLIVYNAKVQRPTVCNALDTLLVHSDIAERYLPEVADELSKASVEIRCDEKAMDILNKSGKDLKPVAASEDDWGKEFLALIIAVKVVSSLDEALEHIDKYGSGHSEAIVTENYDSAMRFLNEVDAACVYANASTRFTDGSQFGMGAELGISTQKMHARGPIGLKELTSYKWIIFGNGQIRG
jgi:glutamate-5-semialdehyde dehydrogenase